MPDEIKNAVKNLVENIVLFTLHVAKHPLCNHLLVSQKQHIPCVVNRQFKGTEARSILGVESLSLRGGKDLSSLRTHSSAVRVPPAGAPPCSGTSSGATGRKRRHDSERPHWAKLGGGQHLPFLPTSCLPYPASTHARTCADTRTDIYTRTSTTQALTHVHIRAHTAVAFALIWGQSAHRSP